MEYLVEFLLLGVGLAMDAFAVSICKGLAMRKVNKKQAVPRLLIRKHEIVQ